MDYALTSARHFARLLSLLLHEPAAIDEQKSALRALAIASKEGPVTLATTDMRLTANGTDVPEAFNGAQDLLAQLIGHGVAAFEMDRGASPADLVGAARILVREPSPGDEGESVRAALEALGARTVRVVDSPAAATEDAPAISPTPKRPHGVGAPHHRERVAADSTRPATDRQRLPRPRSATRTREEAASEIRPPPTDVQMPKGAETSVFSRLDTSQSVNATSRVLEEIVAMAEGAQREGRAEVVAEAFHGVVAREAAVADVERKRAFSMAIRRLTKPALLRAVAQMLPRRRERHDQYLAVLVRTGEDGADALIEQLTNASSIGERRVYFDCLVALNAGIPALVHMLGDARWYVARNAADLLGEMQAAQAEGALTAALKHDDERVRRAAAHSLGRIGTPKAIDALEKALHDSSPDVRRQVAAGLGNRKGANQVTTLARALEEESDTEVQLAILSALGRIATREAVEKLVKAAGPDTRLFKKKPLQYRLAAVQALGDARTATALAALQSFANDKEREMREAVLRALMQAQRASPAID